MMMFIDRRSSIVNRRMDGHHHENLFLVEREHDQKIGFILPWKMLTVFMIITLIVVAASFTWGFATVRSSTSKKRARTGRFQLGNTSRTQWTTLESLIYESLQSEHEATILIIDSNNVRGKDDFRMWNSDLVQHTRSLRQSFEERLEDQEQGSQKEGQSLHIICAVDHGSKPQAFAYPGVGLFVFAGPHRTADDVIAQATRFFLNGGGEENMFGKTAHVFVVTSDGELKRRCLNANGVQNLSRRKKRRHPQPAGKSKVKVFPSLSLVNTFKRLQKNSEESPTTQHEYTTACDSNLQRLEVGLAEIESDIRWYSITHSMEIMSSDIKEQMVASRLADENFSGAWRSSVLRSPFQSTIQEFPKFAFSERTWHRVVVAEVARRLMQKFLLESAHDKTFDSFAFEEYTTFYRGQQKKNKAGETIDAMFLDHRIRHEPDLQLQLLNYLKRSLAPTESTTSASMMDSQKLSNDLIQTPTHRAGEFLWTVVAESREKSQNQILSRYIHEAPSHLQFSRKQDLVDMLKRLAIRERREGDSKPKWYFLNEDKEVENSARVADALAGWTKQPGRGRRSQRRHQSKQTTEDGRPTNAALVEEGQELERQWMDLLRVIPTSAIEH